MIQIPDHCKQRLSSDLFIANRRTRFASNDADSRGAEVICAARNQKNIRTFAKEKKKEDPRTVIPPSRKLYQVRFLDIYRVAPKRVNRA